MTGVIPRAAGSAGMAIIPGDTKTMTLSGADLLFTRQRATSVQLVLVTGLAQAEKVLAERGAIELGEGPGPAPHPAWAILDRQQLAIVRADGTLETVAESLDGDFDWEAAAAAAPPHALAGARPTVYVLESNRARDVDRVLAIEAVP
jgi:hypothetical protein